jgi:hypothetical protein
MGRLPASPEGLPSNMGTSANRYIPNTTSMKKSLILLVICASLTACSDRVRHNCETTKGNGFIESKCK